MRNFSSEDLILSKLPCSDSIYCPVFRAKIRYRLPDGSWTKEHVRDFVQRPDAVGVLLYDPVLDLVVLIKQFRIGAVDAENPWLFEIVAGVKEPNEVNEAVAQREVCEESKLKIKQLVPIFEYFVTPGYSNERAFLYCAEVEVQELETKAGVLEENEYIYLHALSSSAAINLLETGKLKNSFTIIAMQWFQLHHQQLRQKWLTKNNGNYHSI